MTLCDKIRTSLSKVGRKFADGAIEYRSLSSAPDASPRTYTAWGTIDYARCVDFGESQQQDQESGMWIHVETCDLRVPFEAGVFLSIRDQVRQGATAGVSATNKVWQVREQDMSSAGAVQVYHLERRSPMLTNPRHGSNV